MKRAIKYFFKNKKSAKRKKILGPYAKGVIYETENGTIAMPVEDITIGKQLGFKGKWDISEIEKIKNFIHEEDVIYILGTHVGTLLVPLAKKAKKIIGFEANEQTFWFVNMNLCLNKIKNVQLINKAVGNADKTVSFYQNTVNSGGSKIKPGIDILQYRYDRPQTVEVAMIVLDNYIKDQNLPTPQGMIIDIEGAEYAALQGMQQTIKHLGFIYTEYVAHHLKNVAGVSNAQFLDLLCPHFKKAYCFKSDKHFNIEKDNEELLQHLNILKAKGKTDDILFSN